MPVPARIPYTYDEVDSEALPASERFVLWRETGRLPMAAEAPDDESRRHFHIRVRKLSGPSGRFADLAATPMKLSRTRDHYIRDGLDMISLTLMLGPDVQHQFGTAGRSAVVQPGQILIKDFAQPATAWWQTSSRSLNLHLPRLTVEAAVGDKVGRLHGTVLSSVGLFVMLETQLITLANIAPRLRRTVRAAALDTTVELAVSVLRCELGARIEDEANNAGLVCGGAGFHQAALGICPPKPGADCSAAPLFARSPLPGVRPAWRDRGGLRPRASIAARTPLAYRRFREQGENCRYRVSLRLRGPRALHSTVPPTLRPDSQRTKGQRRPPRNWDALNWRI